MSREGRYGKFCSNTDQLTFETENYFSSFEKHLELYLANKIHPAVLVGDYIQAIHKLRKGHLWKGSSFHWFCPLNSKDSFLDFWGKTVLRGIPEKINRTLISWYLGHYPLVLTHSVPTSQEMLLLQSQGKRYITVFKSCDEWKNLLVHNRDHFSFSLHDLIHAHEFFSDESIKNEQILFYQMLNRNYEKLMTLSKDPDFMSSLDYLISDMNSHPAHLEAYFKNLLMRFKLTPYNLNP